jgi:hypothetical protein
VRLIRASIKAAVTSDPLSVKVWGVDTITPPVYNGSGNETTPPTLRTLVEPSGASTATYPTNGTDLSTEDVGAVTLEAKAIH